MKRTWIIGGIVALVLLLAGATIVGGQLFRTQQQAQKNQDSQALPRKLVTPAAGIPTADPDARGDALSHDGNSIMVCESNPVMSINPDGTVNKNGSCTMEVEVVVGHDTNFIHDVSALRNPAPAKQGGSIIVRQFIEPGSADDIGAGTAVRAWGTRSGNRLIARTLLYWNRSPQPAATPGS